MVASDSVSLNSSEVTTASSGETNYIFVFGWNVNSVLATFFLLFGVGHSAFKSCLQVLFVSNLFNTYRGFIYISNLLVCLYIWSYVLSYTFINSYYRLCANAFFWSKFEPLYVFVIGMIWTGFIAGNSFFNTQLFGTFFSTSDRRFSTFSCGFRSKAENCRNGLSFKKAYLSPPLFEWSPLHWFPSL